MGSDDGKRDTSYTIVLVVLTFIVLAILAFETGRGLDPAYVSIFTILLSVSLIGMLVFAAIKFIRDDEETYNLAVFDSSEARGLADKPYSRLIALIVLALIFSAGAISTSHSIIPIIDPYKATQLIPDSQLSIGTSITNGLREAAYPGFGEEIVLYLFTTGLTFLILLGFKRFNEDAPATFAFVFIAMLIASVTVGFMAASAHQQAYGLSGEKYIAAFTYFSTTQFVDQLVGAPVSIVAHFVHNFLVVYLIGVTLSIFAVSKAMAALLPGGFSMKRTKRGNATVYIVLLFVIIPIALLLFWFAGHYAGKFSIAPDTTSTTSQNCGGFMPAPGNLACSADQDCINQLIPAGQSVPSDMQVSCINSVCNVKMLSCGVSK